MKITRKTALLSLFLPFVAFSQATFEVGGIVYTEDLSDPSKLAVVVVAKKSAITGEGLRAYEGNIVIPSTVEHDLDTYEVVGIAPGAFVCNELESLKINDGPTKILMGTISNPDNSLLSLSLPNTIKSIDGIIANGLEEIEIGDNLQWAKNCFMNKVKTLRFPKTLSKLELISALEVRSITLGENMSYIKNSFLHNRIEDLEIQKCKTIERSFWGCENLTSLKLGEGLQTIDYSFDDTPLLKSLNIPMSCRTINLSFRDCKEMENLVIEKGIESIKSSFSSLSNVKSLTIPATCKVIEGSFSMLNNLEELVIEDGVEMITGSFTELDKLKKLVIPKSVKNIDGSFYGGENIDEIIIESTNLDQLGYISIGGELKRIELSCITPPMRPDIYEPGANGSPLMLIVPKGTKEAYIESWDLAHTIEEGRIIIQEK